MDILSQTAGCGAAGNVSERWSLDEIQLDTCILTVDKFVDNLVGKLCSPGGNRVDRQQNGRQLEVAAMVENGIAGRSARPWRSAVS